MDIPIPGTLTREAYNKLPDFVRYSLNGNGEAVRSPEWKYIRYFRQDPVYEELFNLKKDPGELENLANDPALKKTLEGLRERCNEYREELK